MLSPTFEGQLLSIFQICEVTKIMKVKVTMADFLADDDGSASDHYQEVNKDGKVLNQVQKQ